MSIAAQTAVSYRDSEMAAYATPLGTARPSLNRGRTAESSYMQEGANQVTLPTLWSRECLTEIVGSLQSVAKPEFDDCLGLWRKSYPHYRWVAPKGFQDGHLALRNSHPHLPAEPL